MRLIGLLGLGVMTLAACEPSEINTKNRIAQEISCLTQPGTGCVFDQAPLTVLPEPVTLPFRAYKFFPTAEQLTFVDAVGDTWIAPERTLTDGASIPPIFVSIVGDPTSPEFINAAAVHDAYCGVGNEKGAYFQKASWEDVHQMFYDGLIVGGVQPITAKIMFAAVWLGGPRWPDPIGAQVSTHGTHLQSYGGYVRGIDHIPVPELQKLMRATKYYIETKNPSLPNLISFMEGHERLLLKEYPRFPDDDPSREEDPYDYGDLGASNDPTLGGGYGDDYCSTECGI